MKEGCCVLSQWTRHSLHQPQQVSRECGAMTDGLNGPLVSDMTNILRRHLASALDPAHALTAAEKNLSPIASM